MACNVAWRDLSRRATATRALHALIWLHWLRNCITTPEALLRALVPGPRHLRSPPSLSTAADRLPEEPCSRAARPIAFQAEDKFNSSNNTKGGPAVARGCVGSTFRGCVGSTGVSPTAYTNEAASAATWGPGVSTSAMIQTTQIKGYQGVCSTGQWEVDANSRDVTNWGCCSSCPGGNSRCYNDCGCQCSTASSCASIPEEKFGCFANHGCAWDESSSTCRSTASARAEPAAEPAAVPPSPSPSPGTAGSATGDPLPLDPPLLLRFLFLLIHHFLLLLLHRFLPSIPRPPPLPPSVGVPPSCFCCSCSCFCSVRYFAQSFRLFHGADQLLAREHGRTRPHH